MFIMWAKKMPGVYNPTHTDCTINHIITARDALFAMLNGLRVSSSNFFLVVRAVFNFFFLHHRQTAINNKQRVESFTVGCGTWGLLASAAPGDFFAINTKAGRLFHLTVSPGIGNNTSAVIKFSAFINQPVVIRWVWAIGVIENYHIRLFFQFAKKKKKIKKKKKKKKKKNRESDRRVT